MTLFDTENCTFGRDVPIAPKTTFKIGGTAAVYAVPENAEALARLIASLESTGERYIVLGAGSNVLFCGERFDGAVVSTKKLSHTRLDGNVLYAECGVPITSAAVTAWEASLSGLEFAYGIPGSVGGAVFMNAGAYGGQVSDVLSFCRVCDAEGKIYDIPAGEAALSYRDSVFQHEKLVCLGAGFTLTPADRGAIRSVMDDLMQRRKDKQPLDLPSAGSVFKRGNGFITAQVIDECGLKGLSVGGAEVSEKHAGFIVNKGGATAEDVLELIEKVKSEVLRLTGKTIECEIRIIK